MQDLPNALFTELFGSVHGAYGGAATWGQINGTLSNQADLVAAIAAATGGWTTLRLASDFNNSTTSYTDVTGMAFTPVASAQYEVMGLIMMRSAAATTGPQPGVVWPTNVGDGVIFTQQASAVGSTTPRYGNTSGNFVSGVADIADATGSWPLFLMSTFITPSNVSGDWKLQLRSEVNASQATMRAGSFLRYRRIA